MVRRQESGHFLSVDVVLGLFSLLFTSQLLATVYAMEVSKDEVIRYDDRLRAYVNITFNDPLTGKLRSEKFLKGKWGTSGRLEQVEAPVHIAKYGRNKTDGCHKLDKPVPMGEWVSIIERGQCRFSEKIRNAIDANATAVIIYDNEPNKTPLFMHHDVENAVAIFISKEFGDRIVELIEDKKTDVQVRITIGLEPKQFPKINNEYLLWIIKQTKHFLDKVLDAPRFIKTFFG